MTNTQPSETYKNIQISFVLMLLLLFFLFYYWSCNICNQKPITLLLRMQYSWCKLAKSVFTKNIKTY